MLKKIVKGGVLVVISLGIACGGGGGGDNPPSDLYTNPYANKVNGIIVEQNLNTTGFIVKGTEVNYVSALAMENGKLVYSSAVVNDDGTFQINLKTNLSYSFVFFNNDLEPVLVVEENTRNAILVVGNTYIKVIVGTDQNGQLTVIDVEHDENSILEWIDEYVDTDGDLIPDFAESDNDGDGYPDYDEDGDGYFDGVEDNDGDGVIDGSEDTDNDQLPDTIDDDDDNDGIPDEEDDD